MHDGILVSLGSLCYFPHRTYGDAKASCIIAGPRRVCLNKLPGDLYCRYKRKETCILKELCSFLPGKKGYIFQEWLFIICEASIGRTRERIRHISQIAKGGNDKGRGHTSPGRVTVSGHLLYAITCSLLTNTAREQLHLLPLTDVKTVISTHPLLSLHEWSLLPGCRLASPCCSTNGVL